MDRFTLYISNLLPTNASDSTNFAAGEFPIFAGHAHGLTFASQISKLETLRSELTFGQILRGLKLALVKLREFVWEPLRAEVTTAQLVTVDATV
jgi:hypothetical protein